MWLVRSFGFAFEGIGHFLRTQRNARIEVAIAAVAIGAAFVSGFEPLEWAVLSVTIALVLILEGLNTSLEIAVTLASPERQPEAKAAKDIAAGMVLIAAIASVAVGIALFGPRLRP